MVVHILGDVEVDRIFRALADGTRRDILARVLEREESVSRLAERYAMSFAAVQKHVAVLENASLVTKVRRGREQLVHPDPVSLRRASGLLADWEEIWVQRLKRIDEILTEPEPEPRIPEPNPGNNTGQTKGTPP